jgi:hypothetical protein
MIHSVWTCRFVWPIISGVAYLISNSWQFSFSISTASAVSTKRFWITNIDLTAGCAAAIALISDSHVDKEFVHPYYHRFSAIHQLHCQHLLNSVVPYLPNLCMLYLPHVSLIDTAINILPIQWFRHCTTKQIHREHNTRLAWATYKY